MYTTGIYQKVRGSCPAIDEDCHRKSWDFKISERMCYYSLDSDIFIDIIPHINSRGNIFMTIKQKNLFGFAYLEPSLNETYKGSIAYNYVELTDQVKESLKVYSYIENQDELVKRGRDTISITLEKSSIRVSDFSRALTDKVSVLQNISCKEYDNNINNGNYFGIDN